jgi:hypothetical protein
VPRSLRTTHSHTCARLTDCCAAALLLPLLLLLSKLGGRHEGGGVDLRRPHPT